MPTKIPPQQKAGRNLADLPHIKLDQYKVCEYTPLPDGLGQPTEVHLVMDMTDPPMAFVIAMKSRRAVNELIGILARSRDNVWPEDNK